MDTVVAVRATRRSHSEVYFLTWGRIYDPVDTAKIESAVTDYAMRSTDLKDDVKHVAVCSSSLEAASAPYFFESFFEMCQARRPEKGWRLAVWRMKIARRIAKGEEIWFLGAPGDLSSS